jgi:acyl-CoA thioester hydrolase
LRSARFDDEIAVETTLQALGRATLVFAYKITRKSDGILLVEGWTRHACLDASGKVVKIGLELEAVLKTALSD